MSISRFIRLTFVLLVVCFLSARLMFAQDSTNSSPNQSTVTPTYPNTREGLQELLQDMSAAAKAGDKAKLAAFLKEMEIPDCDAWLHKMYDADKANSWVSSCDPKGVASSEKFMEERFLEHTTSDEEIVIRKAEDNPEQREGFERTLLQGIKAPLDIYFASWKKGGEAIDARGEPIGYFVFVDGGFRWDHRIQFGIKTKRIHSNVVPARLIKKVDPAYPPGAASQHISGIVRVNFVIGTDGAVRDAHAVSGGGLSNDPFLMKAAEEAVSQWRYEPATLEGKSLQTNGTVDITFSPRN